VAGNPDDDIHPFFLLGPSEQDAELDAAAAQAALDVGREAPPPSPAWLAAHGAHVERLLLSILPQLFGGDPSYKWANCREEVIQAPGKDGKPPSSKTVLDALPARGIMADLLWAAGGWPRRAGGMLFAVDRTGADPLWIEDANALFAWAAGRLEHPVLWAEGFNMTGRGVFYKYLLQHADRYEAVETLPHAPPVAGHYYLEAIREGIF
jgi:hypothetical protein